MLAIRCASGQGLEDGSIAQRQAWPARRPLQPLCRVGIVAWWRERSPGAVRGSVLCPPQAAEVRHDAPHPLCEMVQSQVRTDGSASTELIYHERVICHEKVTVKRISSVGLLVLVLAGVPSPAQGQGWYLGSELGAHVIPTLDITGLSNDRASVCDEFINPQYATVTQTAGYETYNCTGPDRSNNWVNQFAKATGLHTGWALGYRFGADASGSRWASRAAGFAPGPSRVTRPWCGIRCAVTSPICGAMGANPSRGSF